MSKNEMKPEDVMVALDVCIEGVCEACPYHGKPLCRDDMMIDALALLREKDAEIERLRAQNDHLVKEAVFAPMERAKNTLSARAEAITEFAERLKDALIKGGIYPVFVKNSIAKIAKELESCKKN